MLKIVPEYLRTLTKAVAVYAAGAWVAVEVVDFAVRQYGLSKFLVDASVIVAFGGGMVTAVLVWFHGEPGTQKTSASEILAICGIVVATASGLLYLSSGGPIKTFDNLSGYRLTLEYREIGYDDGDGHYFVMAPIEAIEVIDGGILSLAPEDGNIHGPTIRAQFSNHPTMFIDPPDSDFAKVVFVLPHEPTDLSELIALGATHGGAKIDTSGLSLEIDSNIVITEQVSGATIRVTSRAAQDTSQQ